MLEYVARAFPFRHEPNATYARTLFNIAEGQVDQLSESEFPSTAGFVLSAGGRWSPC